jgi:Acyl-CoA carboxylase epsilon subunit
VTVGELPELRIVRGDPSPDELAALTAVITTALAAAGRADHAADTAAAAVHSRWNDPAHTLRRPWPVGPGGWRAAGY